MDAFVTRSASMSAANGHASSALASNARLKPNSHIPSYLAAAKYERTDASTSKLPAAVASEACSGVSAAATGSSMSRLVVKSKSSSLRNGKLKQSVIEITSSLKSADNPITNSTCYSSAFHYVSCSSGHQANGGFHRSAIKNHNLNRTQKLKAQGAKAENEVLKGVKCYINGDTTPLIGNLDLIRIIQENGGEVRYAFSKRGCTHIICTQNLSASKTHKELNSRKASTTKVVSPRWVLDSVAEGRKLAETKYKVLSASDTQHSIREMTIRDGSKSRSVSREAGDNLLVEISSSSQESTVETKEPFETDVAHQAIEIASSQ